MEPHQPDQPRGGRVGGREDGIPEDVQAGGDQTPVTVEELVRARLATELGGLRGSLETALPLVVFTVAYLLTEVIRTSVIVAVGFAVASLLLRLVQRSSTRFVLNGLVGIVIAAGIASFTGQAEAAFLPSIAQNAVWVLVLGGSILVRWPLGGLLVGAILGDTAAWRDDPAIVRLGYRLTLILLAPMVIRLIVQVPLYLDGSVGWLGISRLVLGWPLYAAALAVAGLVLLRGETPVNVPVETFTDDPMDEGTTDGR